MFFLAVCACSFVQAKNDDSLNFRGERKTPADTFTIVKISVSSGCDSIDLVFNTSINPSSVKDGVFRIDGKSVPKSSVTFSKNATTLRIQTGKNAPKISFSASGIASISGINLASLNKVISSSSNYVFSSGDGSWKKY